MTVEIDGVYLTALEKMADKYNEETLKMWDEGKSVYLRKKENAESILFHIIFEYLSLKYPDELEEITERIKTDISNVKGKEIKSGEEFDTFIKNIETLTEMNECKLK